METDLASPEYGVSDPVPGLEVPHESDTESLSFEDNDHELEEDLQRRMQAECRVRDEAPSRDHEPAIMATPTHVALAGPSTSSDDKKWVGAMNAMLSQFDKLSATKDDSEENLQAAVDNWKSYIVTISAVAGVPTEQENLVAWSLLTGTAKRTVNLLPPAKRNPLNNLPTMDAMVAAIQGLIRGVELGPVSLAERALHLDIRASAAKFYKEHGTVPDINSLCQMLRVEMQKVPEGVLSPVLMCVIIQKSLTGFPEIRQAVRMEHSTGIPVEQTNPESMLQAMTGYNAQFKQQFRGNQQSVERRPPPNKRSYPHAGPSSAPPNQASSGQFNPFNSFPNDVHAGKPNKGTYWAWVPGLSRDERSRLTAQNICWLCKGEQTQPPHTTVAQCPLQGSLFKNRQFCWYPAPPAGKGKAKGQHKRFKKV